MLPSSKADTDVFGAGSDDSDPINNRYYMTTLNLPWAIDIPDEWDYPKEKSQIIHTYKNFKSWAESSGDQAPDWFKNREDNVNEGNIYSK